MICKQAKVNMDAVNSIYHLPESKALFISLFLFYRDKVVLSMTLKVKVPWYFNVITLSTLKYNINTMDF